MTANYGKQARMLRIAARAAERVHYDPTDTSGLTGRQSIAAQGAVMAHSDYDQDTRSVLFLIESLHYGALRERYMPRTLERVADELRRVSIDKDVDEIVAYLEAKEQEAR